MINKEITCVLKGDKSYKKSLFNSMKGVSRPVVGRRVRKNDGLEFSTGWAGRAWYRRWKVGENLK